MSLSATSVGSRQRCATSHLALPRGKSAKGAKSNLETGHADDEVEAGRVLGVTAGLVDPAGC